MVKGLFVQKNLPDGHLEINFGIITQSLQIADYTWEHISKH